MSSTHDHADHLPLDDGSVVLKGVREDPSPEDGTRVLVDRLWPRGVSKTRAALDEWAKDATPSTALRKAFHAGDLTFPEFADAYRAELEDREEAVHAVSHLRELARAGRVTLLYAAKDEVHNNAVALEHYLEAKLVRGGGRGRHAEG